MVAVCLSVRCPGIAGNSMEPATMVPSSIGGSTRLHFPVVADAGFPQSIFLHLFVCIRSLAIPGLPGNHHALRQRDRPARWTIETSARLAGAWSRPAACQCTVPPDLAAKPNVYRHRNALSDDYCPESRLLDGVL